MKIHTLRTKQRRRVCFAARLFFGESEHSRLNDSSITPWIPPPRSSCVTLKNQTRSPGSVGRDSEIHRESFALDRVRDPSSTELDRDRPDGNEHPRGGKRCWRL